MCFRRCTYAPTFRAVFVHRKGRTMSSKVKSPYTGHSSYLKKSKCYIYREFSPSSEAICGLFLFLFLVKRVAADHTSTWLIASWVTSSDNDFNLLHTVAILSNTTVPSSGQHSVTLNSSFSSPHLPLQLTSFGQISGRLVFVATAIRDLFSCLKRKASTGSTTSMRISLQNR